MADLAKASYTVGLPKYLGPIILLLHIVFITYLVFQINQSEELALAKFKDIRNIAYLIYIGLFTLIGILIILKKLMKNLQKTTFLTSILQNLVISLILTTFSYFLASIVVDFMNLFE